MRGLCSPASCPAPPTRPLGAARPQRLPPLTMWLRLLVSLSRVAAVCREAAPRASRRSTLPAAEGEEGVPWVAQGVHPLAKWTGQSSWHNAGRCIPH